MNCRELIDFLADYLGGELPEAERVEFEKHVEACPPCLDYMKTYQKTICLCREAMCHPDEEQSAPPLPEPLIQAILEARRKASGS